MSDANDWTTYDGAIRDIYSARSLADIDKIAERYSAEVTGPNGGLYSGTIGGYDQPDSITSANLIDQIESHTDTPLINRTERGRFLSDERVSAAIDLKAQELFITNDHAAPADAEKMAKSYLYGSVEAGQTPLASSLWGQASEAYAQSLHGDVPVFATNANASRVFGQVEFKTALENPNVTSIGGVPVEQLRDQVARDDGDVSGALKTAQAGFRGDVSTGLFVGPDSQAVFSQEFADKYHASGDYSSAAQLRASGLSTPNIDPAAIVPISASTLRMLDPEDRAALTAPETADPAADPAAQGQSAFLLPEEMLQTLDAEDRAAFASSGNGDAGGLGEEGAGETESLGTKALHGADLAERVITEAYDAFEIAKDFSKLQASHNQYAATDLLRTEAIEHTSALTFGAAGAAVAGTIGIPAGPGDVLISGIGFGVGSVIGEFGGDEIAGYFKDRSIKLNEGTDGKTYQYDGGQWKTTHSSWTDPGAKDTPAPAAQIRKLEMERTTKIADLAIAQPSTLDPDTLSAADPQTGITRTWERTGAQTWSSRVDDCTSLSASPELVAKLNLQSQHVAASGPTSADAVAKAYVSDYYTQKWDELGPLPDSVTTQLHLPSEQTIKDPQTGITWNVAGNTITIDAALGPNGGASSPTSPQTQTQTQAPVRPSATLAPTPAPAITPAPGQSASPVAPATNGTSGNPTPVAVPPGLAPPQPRLPTPDETARVLALRDQAVFTNQVYGKNLIDREVAEVQQAQASPVPAVPEASTVVRSGPACAPEAPTADSPPGVNATNVPGPTFPPSGGASPEPAPTAPAAATPTASTQPQDPSQGSSDGSFWSGIVSAIQSRLEQLRSTGLNLPDVATVQPYAPRSQTGSFVQVDPDTVAQHVGQGTYQVASVSQDLNGTTPPEGQPVTLGPQGQVPQLSQPEVARSFGRME